MAFTTLFQALTPTSSSSTSSASTKTKGHLKSSKSLPLQPSSANTKLKPKRIRSEPYSRREKENNLYHEHHELAREVKYRNYKDHLEKIMMHAAHAAHIQEPPREEVNSSGKGTGFPEPLSVVSNTTLPHPDADTSKNATIEAEDIAPVRTHTHRSFLGRHHSKNTNHGKLTAEEIAIYDNIQYADGTTEEHAPNLERASPEAERKLGQKPSTSQDTLVNAGRECEESDNSSIGEKKRGVLRKLHSRKV